jgi:hypothetical protein
MKLPCQIFVIIFCACTFMVQFLATPQPAFADKGGGHDGDGGHGGGDDRGGRDRGRGDNGEGRREAKRGDEEHTYDGGWLTTIRNGRFNVFDPSGRLVISRKARPSDYSGF